MLYSVLVAVDVLLAIGIIGLVLIQQGKGADVGAAFGGGASGTVFGARGSASFLTRATAILVALFFINSLVLAYLASHRPVAESVITTTPEMVEEAPQIKAVIDQMDASDTDIPSIESDNETEMSDIPEVEESATDATSAEEEGSSDSIQESSESTQDDVPE